MQLFAETKKNTLAPWALNFHEQEFYFQLNFLQRYNKRFYFVQVQHIALSKAKIEMSAGEVGK
jgi:hypothetical protein